MGWMWDLMENKWLDEQLMFESINVWIYKPIHADWWMVNGWLINACLDELINGLLIMCWLDELTNGWMADWWMMNGQTMHDYYYYYCRCCY